MKKYDTIFLDRDGTLNPDPGYISSLAHYKFYTFTIPALKLLADQGNRFCIVTNQSGIGRGIIQPRNLDAIHEYVKSEFIKNHIPLLGIYICTDKPENATERRKPNPGMFLEAASEHAIDLGQSLMIGDADSDINAGTKLGMDTMLVLTGIGQSTLKSMSTQIQPTYVVKDFLDGAHLLVGREAS